MCSKISFVELLFTAQIWLEIMARLPVCDLLRLRSVCKSLLYLIDHPDFSVLHLNKIRTIDSVRTMIMLEEVKYGDFLDWEAPWHVRFNYINLDTLETISTISLHDIRWANVKGFVDGLWLLWMELGCRSQLVVLNVSIRKMINIPMQCADDLIALMLDLCFGSYALKTGGRGYKVVGFDSTMPRLFTFDLSKGYWELKKIKYPPGVHFYSKRVYVGSESHWICDSKLDICSFDFSAEEFTLLAMPCEVGNRNYTQRCQAKLNLAVIDGLLGLIDVSPIGSLSIWTLKFDNIIYQWRKVAFVHDMGVQRFHFLDGLPSWKFYDHKRGILYGLFHKKLIGYDCLHQEWLDNIKPYEGYHHSFIFSSIESLIMLRGDEAVSLGRLDVRGVALSYD